jgi:hypothetical protein
MFTSEPSAAICGTKMIKINGLAVNIREHLSDVHWVISAS